MEVQAPKGTKDMLPQDAYKWHFVEKKFREIAKFYGMREIRTPMFEHTDLFLRGVGDTTDIVQKEMYTFNDKGNRSITLKPEGTAPVVRAFIENRLFNEAQPTKLYYAIPCFRYENVQKGRLRQFHQFGTEVFGSKEPSMDAEVIAFAMEFLKSLGLKSLSLNINNLGCPNCRPKYNEALKKFLEENYDDLCGLCQSRFEKNPMRILDCKNKNCGEITKNAPIILDYMCEECDTHFTEVKKYLDEGIEIPNEGLYDLYIGARGEDGKLASFKLANALRTRGIKTEINHMGRSLKAEMKYANKIGAKFTVVLGDDELQTGNAKFKRMSDGEQFEVNLNNIEEIVAILNS